MGTSSSPVSSPMTVSVFCLLCTIPFTGMSSAQSADKEPSHSPGWVVISVDEYRVLRAKAFPTERDQELPPVEVTLTRVDYDLRVASDLATGRASLTVDVIKDGWVRVPIPAGLMVREARLEGKPLSLVQDSSGKGGRRVSALLSHPGRSVLLLDVAFPVVSSAGNESISLPESNSGVTRAMVEIPRQGVDVRVAGGLLTENSESSTESKWLAYGHGREPLTFTWRRRTEDHRSTQPLRLRGSLTELVSLGEDSTSISAEASVEIIQGVAPYVRIHIPDQININQVSGAVVADWEVKSGELVVTFLEPLEHDGRFVITGETRLPREGQIQIPLFHLLNTERETGGLAVEVLGAGEMPAKDLKTQGLEDADASDLGEMVSSRQSPSLAAFRFRVGDPAARSLSVNVARYTQQAVLLANVEEARYRVLLSNDGKTLVQVRYAVRNNQRNFLKITLPPGAIVWSAALSGKPVRPGQAPDGSLLLPLEKSRGGDEAPEFAVEMVYFARGPKWDDKGEFKLMLPALDLPVSRNGLLVYYPPLFRVTPQPGGEFRTGNYENPASAVLSDEIPVGTGGGIGGGTFALSKESPQSAQVNTQADSTQALVDKFRTKSLGARATGILPIRVSFPAFGSSVFLVSELTSPSQSPTAALTYQREKKGSTK